MTEYSSNQPIGKEWTEKERRVPRTLTSTETCCPALPNAGCRSIVGRACGPSVAVINAEALAGAPPLRPHQQGKSTRPGNAPRRNPGPDGLAGFVPPAKSTAHRGGPTIGTSGHPLEPVCGNQSRCREFCSARSTPQYREGASAFATSPSRAQISPRSTPRPSLPRFSGSTRSEPKAPHVGRYLPRIQHCCPRAGEKELCPLRTTRGSGDA